MQKILRKRILRDFRKNLPRYLALGLMIILGMYIVISLVAAADTVMAGSAGAAREQLLEDGQFSLFAPMSSTARQRLEDAGVTVEEHFYLDCQAEGDSVLRVSALRQEIDIVRAHMGRLPEGNGEALLERRYCEEHGISVGDEIQLGGQAFRVCGIGTSPDYDTPYRNLSDNVVDSRQFGTAFVSQAAYESLKEAGGALQSEEYVYGYLLNNRLTDRELKDLLKGFAGSGNPAEAAGFPGLLRLLPAKDNARIGGAADDVVINKATGLFAGILLIVLFSYVISVFVVHTIEKESEVIGTLYALGVKSGELLCHYLLLPVMLTLIAGVAGTVLGYSSFGVSVQLRDVYQYFSLPDFPVVHKPYLLVYGIVMPPAAAALTNQLVIRGRLKRPALALIRREEKPAKFSNCFKIDFMIPVRETVCGQEKGKSKFIPARLLRKACISDMGFVRTFQIRHFLREARTALTVFLGMFLALLVCMIGLNCYVLCEHVRKESVEDTRYEYLYTLKYPEEIVPEGGEEAFGVTLKKEVLGYRFDVMLLGIHPDNPYFDAPVEKGQGRVLVSSAMAGKYGLKAGDELVLDDEENDRKYAFAVDGIVPYSAGMAAFMDIGSMRELMGEGNNYYNIILSNQALDIEPDRLYATASKASVEKGAAVFAEKMWPMVRMVTAASALLFLVVMYLMLKVMIDRCALPISMMKVFGYRKREIRRLYLSGNLVIVAASAAVGIPLSKLLMDAAYPYLVSNVAVNLNLSFGWQMYAGLFAAILLLYLIITPLLMRRVNRILPAEALKNRE